jgi:hypothetical protein
MGRAVETNPRPRLPLREPIDLNPALPGKIRAFFDRRKNSAREDSDSSGGDGEDSEDSDSSDDNDSSDSDSSDSDDSDSDSSDSNSSESESSHEENIRRIIAHHAAVLAKLGRKDCDSTDSDSSDKENERSGVQQSLDDQSDSSDEEHSRDFPDGPHVAGQPPLKRMRKLSS